MNRHRVLGVVILQIGHELLGLGILHRFTKRLVALPVHDNRVHIRSIGVEFRHDPGLHAVLFPDLVAEWHVCVYVVFFIKGCAFLAGVEDDDGCTGHCDCDCDCDDKCRL